MIAIHGRMRTGKHFFAIALLSILLTFTHESGAADSGKWTPEQPVEILVSFGPGGAGDRLARTLQTAFQDTGLITTVVVNNKPGGAGNLAWSYLKSREGNGHSVALITLTIMTNHITGSSQYNYSDFTPIASLFGEPVLFTVRADSAIKDWSDLSVRMKKDPKAVTLVSTSRAGAAPLAFAMALKAIGIDPKTMKLVVFNSAGEALTAALGGHADVNLSTPASVSAHLGRNGIRALAISSERRMAQGPLAAVPTLNELGVNVSFTSWRAVVGPPGLTPRQITYWYEAFSKLMATKAWSKALMSEGLEIEYKNSADTRAYLKQQYEQLRSILTELGLAKN